MKQTKQVASSNSTPSLQTRDGKKLEIPYEGSLGLLALGDVGLKLWREAKEKNKPTTKT